MSYGLYKYIVANELSGSSNVSYRIELLKSGYAGASEQLEGTENYFEHIYNKINPRNPFENPVQSSQLIMSFHVQGQDELDLLEEIFAGDEDQYLLQKKVDGSVVWQGRVLNDLLEYDEGDYPFPGRIIAKDLSYLKGLAYPFEDNKEKIIVTLAGALNELGFGLDIYTYTNWVENNQSNTSDDFLNQVYNDTYAFRNYGSSAEQDDTVISQYDVIDRICRNYNLILRQSNNAWHLFHISALDDPTSVKRYSYDSNGAPNSPASSTEDLTVEVNSTDLYVLPFSGNRINPAIKKARVTFEHRSGTTQTLINASRITNTTDPDLPVAKYNAPFQSAGDEIVELSGRNYAVLGRSYYDGMARLPQASYLLKAGQYYWNNDAGSWQEFADITTSKAGIAPEFIDTANNKIRISSNDFVHGDVIRVDEDLTGGTNADTEYYLIDVSGTVETGSNTFYYQLSEEPDGTPVNLSTKTASTHNIYRVSNREQMVTTTPLAFDSTVWWYDFNVITTEVPADADGDIEFYAMAAIMPARTLFGFSEYAEYASPTNFWQDTLVILKDPTTANGDSYVFELEQSGNYSTEITYPEVYFGDGPLDYSRSALLVTDVSAADTPASEWDFVGGSTNSNFHEIWLKEVLNVQRTARRNLRTELYGEFEAYQVLSHDSKYFFFLGGTQRGRNNRWDADFFEINIETGTDTFTTIINSQNSGGTGGSGGGTNASVEGLSLDFADSRYLQITNDLSDVDDASTARTNLGLAIGTDVQAQNELLEDISGLTIGDGTFLVGDGSGDIVAESGNTARTSLGLGSGDSPTFAGLTVNGNITVTGNVDGRDVSADGADLDELYTTIGLSALTASEVDQLENIGGTTISATQWGYLGDLDQGLTTASAVTFTTVDTGQGANKLYAMNQDVQTTDSPTFNRVVLTNQADDGTKAVRADREVNAGDGLTGGGDLTTDRTFTLGTPGTTEVGGSNAVTSDSHTHALDLSGRTLTIANDTNGVLTFLSNAQNLGDNRTWTPTVALHASGQDGALQATDSTVYGAKTFDGNVFLNTKIESLETYSAGIFGTGTIYTTNQFPVDDNNISFLEVDNMRVRNEFRAHIFKKDIVKASNAYLFITDSAEIAEFSDIQTTADTFKVLDDTNNTNATFEHLDLLWAKNVEDDGSLQVDGVKIQVSVQPKFVWDNSTQVWDADPSLDFTGYGDGFATGTISGGIYDGKSYKEYNIYEVTEAGELNAGDTIVRVNGGSILNDASSAQSPFIDIYDGVNTWADFQNLDKTKVRLGNLAGVSNASGYGLYTQNAFLTGSLVVGDLTKVGQYMEFNGSTLTVKGDVDITGTTIFKSAKDGSTTPTNLNEATFIDGGTIVTNTITATEIDANTITANEIASNTITASQIASNTITSSEIAANTITAFEITAGTITATEIATGTITSNEIAAGTITATEIDVADLFAENIEVTGKLTATDGTYEITLGELAGVDAKIGTFTSNGEFYGLYRDLHNYFGIHDGDLFTEYAFRVGDANNFLEFNGTDLTIETDAFTLETTNLSIDSANEIISIGSANSVTLGFKNDLDAEGAGIEFRDSLNKYATNVDFFGLYLDTDNYFGFVIDNDGNVSDGYNFRVGGDTSNYLEVNSATGDVDINFDTFTLDATDDEGGIKIDSANELIQLEDANRVRTQVDVNYGDFSLTETVKYNADDETTIDQTGGVDYETGAIQITKGDSFYIDIEAELIRFGTLGDGTSAYITVSVYGGTTSGSQTNLIATYIADDLNAIGQRNIVRFSAHSYTYEYINVEITVNSDDGDLNGQFKLKENVVVKSYNSQTRVSLDGVYVNSSDNQYAQLTRGANELAGIFKLIGLPTKKPQTANIVYNDNGTLKIS